MTDIAMSFHETVAERAIQKNSAFHKKNGSAVAKLGNKPMSWQEINSKHGECKTFDMNGFPTYSEFVEFPNDLKVEYINKLMDKYDIDLQHISRYLFNKGDDGIRSYLRNNKLLKLCDYQKPRAKTGLLKFQSDIEDWRKREKVAKTVDDAEAQRKRDIIWNAEFITYEEMKKLPVDGQVNYINNVIKKYSVSINALAKLLFRVDQTSFRRHFMRLNVYDQLEKSRSGNPTHAKEQLDAFEKAIAVWRGENIVEQKEEKNEETKLEELKTIINEETKEPVLIVDSISNTIYKSDPDKIQAALDEATEKLNDVAEKYDRVTEDDVNNALGVGYIPGSEKFGIELSTVKAVQKPQNMIFSANYISETGLDEQQLYALISLFSNKKVQVQINVEVMNS